VLSTGRPLETCISYAEDLQLSSYLITSNGAEIFDKDQTLVEQHVMEPDIIEKMWSIAHEHNIDTWMVATDAVFIRGKRPSNFTDHTWLKFGYGELDEVHKLYVLEQLKQLGPLEITNSSLVNLEVNLKGVHKASAIHS